jgi:hypothetical protein
LAEGIEIIGRSKIVPTDYIMNVLSRIGRNCQSDTANEKSGLTVAMALGETSGSILALSKLTVSIRQLAWALCGKETKRSASEVRRAGDMIV